MKSSHSRCRKVQKALLHNRRFYCTTESFTMQWKAIPYSRRFYCIAESFTTQQEALLHYRKFYCTAEGFTIHQKVLLYSRKVGPVAEIWEKFILRQKQRINSNECKNNKGRRYKKYFKVFFQLIGNWYFSIYRIFKDVKDWNPNFNFNLSLIYIFHFVI